MNHWLNGTISESLARWEKLALYKDAPWSLGSTWKGKCEEKHEEQIRFVLLWKNMRNKFYVNVIIYIYIIVCCKLYRFLLHMDFPGGSDGKVSVYNVRDLGSIPGLGRFPGEGNGNPLQYSCLENPMDGGAWCRLLSMGSQKVWHDWALHFTNPIPEGPTLMN